MESKEVTTTPREQPSTRNVAIPLSPALSQCISPKPDCKPFETHTDTYYQTDARLSHKSIQTPILTDTPSNPRKSVQTCISSIEIANERKIKACRKTKSQEDIRISDDLEEIRGIMKDLILHSDVNANFCARNNLLRRLRRLRRTERNDRIKVKLGRCVKNQLCSQDYKNYTRNLSNELLSKIRTSSMFQRRKISIRNLTAEVVSTRSNNDKSLSDIVKEWVDCIPIKTLDYLGTPVKKEYVLQAVSSKIKSLVKNKIHRDRCVSVKTDILDILEDVPIDVTSRNRNYYLNKITSDLIWKIKNVSYVNGTDRKNWQKVINLDKTLRSNFKTERFAFTYKIPSDNELKQFIKQELKDFTNKFNVVICPSTEKEIEIELIDILIDSLNTLKRGEDEKVKKEILITLSDFINISENEGIYFGNNLIYNYKNMLKEQHTAGLMPQTYVVLQDNSMRNPSNQTLEDSIEGFNGQDSTLNKFTKKIEEQINEWMLDIKSLDAIDSEYKKTVTQDLAIDIVDRCNYLELNSRNSETDIELEYLKYHIFKRINKVIGKHNLETIERAPQLMQRIQSIPVPNFKKTGFFSLNAYISNASCSKEVSQLLNKKGSDSSVKETELSKKDSDSSQPITSNTAETPFKKPVINYDNNLQNCSVSCKSASNGQDKYCATKIDTKNHGVMTDLSHEQMVMEASVHYIAPSYPSQRKTAFTETDTQQIPKTCPRGTNTSMIERPRVEYTTKRRFSAPPGPGSPNRPMEYREFDDIHSQFSPANTTRASAVAPRSVLEEPKDTATILKELHVAYNDYLLNWISQIPIITSKPEELAAIDTLKKRIFDGVWKTIMKLNMNGDAFHHPFYYRDLFDDDLEELLDLLPKSSELNQAKQMLKNQLIERTMKMNDEVLQHTDPPSYKQKLIDNVGIHIPRKELGAIGSNPAKLYDDALKRKIAEIYIIYSRYRENDNVKANVYKRKLIKHLHDFYDHLKRTHGITNVDFKTYKDEIIKALQEVPQPSDESIRAEATEVLIAIEIANWFVDLPLYDSDNDHELLVRKQYRNILAKQIYEMEKRANLNDCLDELRHTITRFVAKLPIRQENIENTPFIVEELVNRLINRTPDVVEGSKNRQFVIEPFDYDEFSRHMNLCSSFSNAPDARKAQINESSYMVRDGERLEGPCYPLGTQFLNNVRDLGGTPDSSEKWLTLPEDTPQPKQVVQKSNPCCPQQPLPGSSASPIRPLNQNQNSNIEWHSLVETQMPSEMRESLEPSHFAAQDCCEFPNSRHSIKREPIEDRREVTLQNTCLSDNDNYRYISIRIPNAQQQANFNGSPVRETQIPVTVGPQNISYHPQPLIQVQEQQSPCVSRRQEVRFSGACAAQTSPERTPPVDYSRNTERSGFQNLPSCGVPVPFPVPSSFRVQGPQSQVIINPEYQPAISSQPPFPSGISNRPCNEPQPGTSKEQYYNNASIQYLGGLSTPQEDMVPPKPTKPKKRNPTQQVEKSRRDAVRKKMEWSDSDDDEGSEEVRCRCMERIWRRKRRSMFTPCEECEMEFPPCFMPYMRCPHPYYF